MAHKVVEFAQSSTKSKSFRHNYPISEKLRHVMVDEVFRDFNKYAIDRNYQFYLPIMKVFLDDHHVKKEKLPELELNLFWWRLLFDLNLNVTNSVEDYIAKNIKRLSKQPFLISWLRECKRATPKFYRVGDLHNNEVLDVTELLTKETFEVLIEVSQVISPIKGEIVIGTLLPLGAHLFFPVTDFYHFDYKARVVIAQNLHYYFDKHLKESNIHEAFINVLSAMLQIERMVLLS